MTIDWHARLRRTGFREAAIPLAVDNYAKVAALFESKCGDPAAADAWWIPGRIEVLGKHTDYGGGRSLACAVERGLHLLAQPRTDGVLQVVDASTNSAWTGSICGDLHPAPGEWFDYPLTVARRLARDFPGTTIGMDMVFLSSIPRAAGLSSSSALVVASALPLIAFNQLRVNSVWERALPTDATVAGYLGAVENGMAYGGFPPDFGVGTHGGSEDHTAILCSRGDQLGSFHYLPVTEEARVSLPEGLVFVVGSSGVQASKASGVKAHYNALSAQLSLLLSLWRQATTTNPPSLFAAMQATPTFLPAFRELVGATIDGDRLLLRLAQFIEETEIIIPETLAAIGANDLTRVGHLVDRSQTLAEQVLVNQIPETVYLARSARSLGAIAASAFGAGFGGSVWALVPANSAATFLVDWRTEYQGRFPERTQRSEFFVTRPGPGATQIVGAT